MDISNIEIPKIADKCVEKMYSGRDLSNLCQLTMWNMVREENKNLSELANLSYEELMKRSLKVRSLEMKDFYDAFENIKTPLSENDIDRYDQWSKEFGE